MPTRQHHPPGGGAAPALLLLAFASTACTEAPATPAPEAEEQGSDGVDGLGGDTHLDAIYGGGGMRLRFLGSEGAVLEEFEIAGVPQDGLLLTGDALSVSAGDPDAPTTSTPETEAYLDEAAWMWHYVEEEIEVMGYVEPLSAYCDSGEECGKVGVSFTLRADPSNTDSVEPLVYELWLARIRLGTVSGCAVDVVHQDPELASAEPVVGRDQIYWGNAWVAHPALLLEHTCNGSEVFEANIAWVNDRWPDLSGIEASWAFDPEVAWVAEDPFGTPE